MSEASENQLGTVGVLGFGTMGAGIAQTCATAGWDTVVVDVTDDAVARGRQTVEHYTDRAVQRGKLDAADRAAALRRLTGTTDFEDLRGSELVIEAVVESPDIKRAVLGSAASVVDETTVIATNTSALSVSALARDVPEPGRFLGLHFFNPAPLMPLVEVVRALQTSDEAVAGALAFTGSIGKAGVVVADRPGFLVNSLLMPYLNQAVDELDRDLGEAEDIDLAVRLGLGYPMGPYELLDLIGLDTHRHATAMAYEQTGDPALAPPPLLQRMVAAGWLGRKAGKGFREGAEQGG